MISDRGSVRRGVLGERLPIKWRAILAVVLLWIAALTGAVWVFAILFIIWAIADILTGEAHLIEAVPRATHPVTFWAVVVSWIAMSALWLFYA